MSDWTSVQLEKLKEMVEVQCSDGNWNYDPYMHGMANGMIFAVACMEDKEPEYLDSPGIWLKDVPIKEAPSITDVEVMGDD